MINKSTCPQCGDSYINTGTGLCSPDCYDLWTAPEAVAQREQKAAWEKAQRALVEGKQAGEGPALWTWPEDFFKRDDAREVQEKVAQKAWELALAASDAQGAPNPRDCYRAALEWLLEEEKIWKEFGNGYYTQWLLRTQG